MSERSERDRRAEEDDREDIGAEGGTGGSFDTPPGMPKPDDDETPLGDSDQHSEAGA